MATLKLHFDNPNKFFFEGELIVGKLEVVVTQHTDISNIVANFLGICDCINESGEQSSKTKFYTKSVNEVYFDDLLLLFDHKNKELTNFSSGTYPFPFEYRLPCGLPSSVEFPYGHVRYTAFVIAIINGETVKVKEHFTVIAKVDLNNDSSAILAGVAWKYDNQCIFSPLCRRNGLIRAYLHIPKRGYVPGEYLSVNAEVNNFHRRLPIMWVKASIVQILECHNGKEAKRKRVVADVTRGSIMPLESQMWRSENILIPAIPPTTYPPKRLVQVRYKLYFQIRPSWQDKSCTLKQRLIIGAVPLLEIDKRQEKGQGEGEIDISSNHFNNSNLESCYFGPHSIEEDGTTCSFSPVYPMYTEAEAESM